MLQIESRDMQFEDRKKTWENWRRMTITSKNKKKQS